MTGDLLMEFVQKLWDRLNAFVKKSPTHHVTKKETNR